jgi:hypothetical protein
MQRNKDGGDAGFVYLKNGETPGKRYERLRSVTGELLSSSDPKEKALIAKENAKLFRIREVSPGAVQDSRFLTNLSVQYANDEYIGMMLMPEVQTPALAGRFPKYGKRDRFAAPDDTMGSNASANEVSETRTFGTYACQPYALKGHVDKLTLRNEQAPLDEMVDLTESVADDIALKEEQRILTVVTTAANYASGNTKTLTGAGIWDQAGSDPIGDIQTGVATLFSGKGQAKKLGACNLDTWNVLSRHPQILDLLKYSRVGVAKPAEVADFFGLDGILVSAARNDTANIGQTESYSRIFGKFFAILKVAKSASIRNASFGSTFRFGPKLTRVWWDDHVGSEGGYWSQVSVNEQHLVVANDTGYLISSAIS